MNDDTAEDKINDETVENFIHGSTSGISPSNSPKEPKTRSVPYSPDEFLEIPSREGLPPGIDWRKKGLFHGQESYSSLGEKGTTASVNAYGNILRISKHLDVGRSGIFCADPCLSEPWLIHSRMKQLLDLSKNPEGGFGLCLNPQLVNAEVKPQLQFLHNRWPRYTHNIGDLSVSIQYFVNGGAVTQQYLFARTHETEIRKHAEDTATQTSQFVDDINPTMDVENPTSRNQAKTYQPKENGQAHLSQNHRLPADRMHEIQKSQRQTAEGPIPQDEVQRSETFKEIQTKLSIKDCLIPKIHLQIRESEWVEGSDEFDMDSSEGSGYPIATGQNQYSLVVIHQLSDADKAVGLVIAAFVNGRATKITKTKDENNRETYGLQLDLKDVREFDEGWNPETSNSLEITVAYDLRLMKKGCSWQSTLIQTSVLNVNDLLTQTSFDSSLSLSNSVHFDFIMKRNLEHILSVCSIPVTSQDKARVLGGGNPVALTCGDISGHPVLASASFFAFQFLLEMYSHPKMSPYSTLAERIFETLSGHLEWLFLHIEKDPDDNGQFLAGYWPSGHEIRSLKEYRITQDTSLHIIKAKDFVSTFQKKGKIPAWFIEQVGDFMGNWIKSLRKHDNRDRCMFPRMFKWHEEERYYLSDHVLIWEALGMVGELELLRTQGLLDFPTRLRYLSQRPKRKLELGIYTSEQVRRMILKRFITRNTMTNERMVATYRNAQENSFFLEPLDTVLFYDERKFFNNPVRFSGRQQDDGTKAVLEEWIRTLDIQARHKRSDEKDWQEPLQYALAIQLAKHGYPIDSLPAKVMFDECLRVLLLSCSSSGIFPGFLPSEINIDEGMWHGRNSHWHASFELPYILWRYAKERLEETSGADETQAPLEKSTAASQWKTNKQSKSPVDQATHEQSLIPKFLRAKTAFGDQENTFDMPDAWLVPCPEFLHFNPGISFKNLEMTVTQREMSDAGFRRLVIDIPKRRYQKKDKTPVDPQPCTSEGFFERLRQWRTKQANMLIKKRVILLSSDDKEAAEICLATVPESEKPTLMDFFTRHENQHRHFLDYPSASSNSWRTEFQLSFYQLKRQGKDAQSKPEIALAERIRRGSMGFRFNGDFFNCYWICHIINFGDWTDKRYQDTDVDKSIPEVETLLNDFLSSKGGISKLESPEDMPKKLVWHQRKVLEMILFEKIISKITASTEDILEEIKDVLATTRLSGSEETETIKDLPDRVRETVLFSKIGGDAYLSSRAKWEVLQQLLQVLNEDLYETLNQISHWQSREEDRGNDTPQWTKKDEKRYRPTLRRLQISNTESVRGLQRLRESVQSLRTSMISTREYIRDDLNLSVLELTRTFTYITIVFLPLGFAAAIFSMSETPARATLVRMSGTATVTFFIIVAAAYYLGAALPRPLERVKEDVKRLLQPVERALRQLLRPVKGALKRLFRPVERVLKLFSPPLFITYILLRALGMLMADLFNKLWATSAKSLARLKGELERLLLPLIFAYALWSMLGGSMNNFLNSQELPSPQGSNDGDTDRRDSSAYPPEGSPEGQPLKQRRSASRSGDLENQVRSGHSFR